MSILSNGCCLLWSCWCRDRFFHLFLCQALELLEGGYSLDVTRVNVLEGDDSEKKIKQMKTFSGRDTVPQVKNRTTSTTAATAAATAGHCCCCCRATDSKPNSIPNLRPNPTLINIMVYPVGNSIPNPLPLPMIIETCRLPRMQTLTYTRYLEFVRRTRPTKSASSI